MNTSVAPEPSAAARRFAMSPLDLRVVAVRDGAGARRVADRRRDVAVEALEVLGELVGLGQRHRRPGHALEAGEPTGDVGGVARLAHLAVVHDVDAGGDLTAHGFGHRVADLLLGGHLAVEGGEGAREGDAGGAGQAAGVGGEDAFGAALHGRTLREPSRDAARRVAGWTQRSRTRPLAPTCSEVAASLEHRRRGDADRRVAGLDGQGHVRAPHRAVRRRARRAPRWRRHPAVDRGAGRARAPTHRSTTWSRSGRGAAPTSTSGSAPRAPLAPCSSRSTRGTTSRTSGRRSGWRARATTRASRSSRRCARAAFDRRFREAGVPALRLVSADDGSEFVLGDGDPQTTLARQRLRAAAHPQCTAQPRAARRRGLDRRSHTVRRPPAPVRAPGDRPHRLITLRAVTLPGRVCAPPSR